MWARSPREVALVLDDVHQVPAGSDGAGVLARLVAALPGNAHLVLSGREPPPVDLARLEVHGKVARLDASDLAFAGDELADFAVRRGVPGESLARSGGWPALAELAASAAPDVEAASCGRRCWQGSSPTGAATWASWRTSGRSTRSWRRPRSAATSTSPL